MSVSIVQGSILDFQGDAIINPANSFLRHGGGLAKVIADAAAGWPEGSPYWTEDEAEQQAAAHVWRLEQENHPNIPTGGIGVTSAGALDYAAIIHAVGPIWGGGGFHEDSLLGRAHIEAFDYALERDWSVAAPAISCGIFGFPVERAAKIAMFAAKSYSNLGGDITFYLFEDAHYAAYEDAYKRVNP